MLGRQVLLKNKEGKVIKHFNSIKEAGTFYRISPHLLRIKIINQQVVWKDGAYLVLGESHIYNQRKYKCTTCGNENFDDFYEYDKSMCKKCRSNANNQNYHNLNEIKRQEKMVIQKKWRHNNYIHYRVCGAKHRAKRNNLVFELTDEIIESKFQQQNGLCYISKQKLSLIENDWHGLSLDRLDSDKGYTVDNTILVTKFVNTGKNNLPLDIYLKYIKEISENI